MRELRVHSDHRKQMIDITQEVERLMHDLLQKYSEGALLLFCQHTTAALIVNENADPTVQHDFLQHYGKLVPENPSTQGFSHNFTHGEGNSDSHIQSIMTGSSLLLPVAHGRLALGTWQGVYFCEFDGPRNRKVQCQLIQGLV